MDQTKQYKSQVNNGSVALKGVKTITKVSPTVGAALSLCAANVNRTCVILQNVSANDCYIGPDNTVTTATGFYLKAGTSFIDIYSADAWWGIGSGGTADIRIVVIE